MPRDLDDLTRDEKASLLDGADFWRSQALDGVDAVMFSDGPHGLRTQPEGGDHLGLAGSLPATCFPTAAGLASTWDPELVGRVGEALGREARALGVAVLLGPGVNIKRTPLGGRNFEYFSEDPRLAGELAAAYVRGVQSTGVGASVKHFAVNNQETDRMSISADVDDRTLREIYLPAFERVVTTARPWTVMCSYNRVNGVYASEHRFLLTEVLREQWGFDGLVVSDWLAVHDRVAGVRAGLDLEMPTSGGAGTAAILRAVDAGDLDQADVDRSAARVLTLVDRAAPARTDPGGLDPGTVDENAHHALAHEAAVCAAVLLTNDGVLPLDPAPGDTLAVIGEFARTPRYQGAGSSQVTPTRVDDALGALRQHGEVAFAPGYGADGDLVAEAVDLARRATTTVLFLGLPPAEESEGYDREHLDLPADQLALLDAVTAVTDDVVVVLANGSVVTTGWASRVRAVLEVWLGGQAGGSAVADLLRGRESPSGRLAETVPLRLEHTPAVGAFPGERGHVRYGEGLLVGYRWYDTHALDVAFPFGHGLTYTDFGYDDLAARVVGEGADTAVALAVTVTNTGARRGTETVQVYRHHARSAVARPEQELVGFARVTLDPGGTRRVRLELEARAFAFWDVARDDWTVESGEVELRVGASSRDVRQRATVTIVGDEPRPVLSPESPLGDWLRDPEHGPDLRERLTAAGMSSVLGDDPESRMMQAIPLDRLARMLPA